MLWFKKNNGAETYEYELNRIEHVKHMDRRPMYMQQCKEFMHSLIPADLYARMDRAEPFFYGSFLSWPVFWGFSGLKWIATRRDRSERLLPYIRKTHIQARMLQIGIMSLGVMVALGDASNIKPSGEFATDADEPKFDFLD